MKIAIHNPFKHHEGPIDPTPLLGGNRIDAPEINEAQKARAAELGKIANEGLIDSDSILAQAGVVRGNQAEAAQNRALAELPPVEPANGEVPQPGSGVTPEMAQPANPEDVVPPSQVEKPL